MDEDIFLGHVPGLIPQTLNGDAGETPLPVTNDGGFREIRAGRPLRHIGEIGSSVFLGKIGVAPACRSPSPPVGFTVILAGQKGLGMNTKIHPNCNLTATLQSGQAADART